MRSKLSTQSLISKRKKIVGQSSTFAISSDYTESSLLQGWPASMEFDMPNENSHYSPVFRIDVSADPANAPAVQGDTGLAMVTLMRQMISLQERQNQMLEQLVQQSTQNQKARSAELQQWKDANPRLSRSCRSAAETLSRVQTRFLENMTEEINDNEESLVDGDFMLNEFVDRFGPRMAHLNGVLQMLAQLGNGVPNQVV